MVRVVRSSGKDTLCIVMNHMVSDGAGLKEYLYVLGTLYTKLQTAKKAACPDTARGVAMQSKSTGSSIFRSG